MSHTLCEEIQISEILLKVSKLPLCGDVQLGQFDTIKQYQCNILNDAILFHIQNHYLVSYQVLVPIPIGLESAFLSILSILTNCVDLG